MAGTFARELYLYGLLQSELPWLLLAPKVDICENSVSISDSEQSNSSLHHPKDVQTLQKSVCMFTSYITVDSGLHMYIVLLSLDITVYGSTYWKHPAIIIWIAILAILVDIGRC